jgi:hypothetical protein
MRCPRCQAKNPDNPRFYHHCDQLDDALSEYKEAVRLDPSFSGSPSDIPKAVLGMGVVGIPGRDLGAALRTGQGEPDAALLAETGGHARECRSVSRGNRPVESSDRQAARLS